MLIYVDQKNRKRFARYLYLFSSVADLIPDTFFHFDADPDPTLAFDFDTDSEPACHSDAAPDLTPKIMLIRIRNTVILSIFFPITVLWIRIRIGSRRAKMARKVEKSS